MDTEIPHTSPGNYTVTYRTDRGQGFKRIFSPNNSFIITGRISDLFKFIWAWILIKRLYRTDNHLLTPLFNNNWAMIYCIGTSIIQKPNLGYLYKNTLFITQSYSVARSEQVLYPTKGYFRCKQHKKPSDIKKDYNSVL